MKFMNAPAGGIVYGTFVDPRRLQKSIDNSWSLYYIVI